MIPFHETVQNTSDVRILSRSSRVSPLIDSTFTPDSLIIDQPTSTGTSTSIISPTQSWGFGVVFFLCERGSLSSDELSMIISSLRPPLASLNGSRD